MAKTALTIMPPRQVLAVTALASTLSFYWIGLVLFLQVWLNTA